MNNWYLYVLVFIAGAAVLAVEILGTRILGPFYGVSLFLWSALITVTLAALSVGYAIGGRWADRGPRLDRLCYLMIGAGLWLLLIPWIKRPVLFIAEPFGLRLAVLVATLILFAPPLTLLGMVSPYAIRLRAHHLDEVGRTAGDLYAISTVGSVLAALATGFFLIPNIGVSRLILLIGLALILSAVVGLLAQRSTKGAWVGAAAAILALAPLTLWKLPGERSDPRRGLLAVEQSAYAELRVLDMQGRRHLLIDGGVHTIADPLSFASSYSYVAAIDLTRLYFGTPGKMLLVGLGGGSVAKNFAAAGWAVDAVEIDPAVVDLARRYFGLEPADASVYEMDGRQFLIGSDDRYDVIIMDAFGSSSIPFHLVTVESFGLIAAHLAEDGILAINVESVGWLDRIVRSLSATLSQHFKYQLALPAFADPNELGNVILLAANRDLAQSAGLDARLTSADLEQLMTSQRRRVWENRFVPSPSGAPVLTDELNPVDLWSEAVNFIARKDLHEYFEEHHLSW